MTDTTAHSTSTWGEGQRGPRDEEVSPAATGWTGWIVFASIMLMMVGVLQGAYGFIALVNDDWVVWGNQGTLYVELTTWGLVHLALGVVLVLAGVGLLFGNVVARAVAVLVAVLSVIANFLFIPAYPVWSLFVITINVLVIWAVTVHGREARAT
jgi:hypothetical protein